MATAVTFWLCKQKLVSGARTVGLQRRASHACSQSYKECSAPEAWPSACWQKCRLPSFKLRGCLCKSAEAQHRGVQAVASDSRGRSAC